jgi:hypothetical protein
MTCSQLEHDDIESSSTHGSALLSGIREVASAAFREHRPCTQPRVHLRPRLRPAGWRERDTSSPCTGRYYNQRLRRGWHLQQRAALSQHTVAVSLPQSSTYARPAATHPQVQDSQRIPGRRRSPTWGIAGRWACRKTPSCFVVGNLYPVKGPKHLISALRAITVQHPRAHLAIAGRGDRCPSWLLPWAWVWVIGCISDCAAMLRAARCRRCLCDAIAVRRLPIAILEDVRRSLLWLPTSAGPGGAHEDAPESWCRP